VFEQALFQYVKDNFQVTDSGGSPIADLTPSIHFGEAPESTEAPYAIMYVLDSDGDPQTLCDEQFDSGNSLIQFNIYYTDMKNSFYIKQQLNEFLTQIPTLTLGAVSYTINRTTHGASPSAQTLTNGLAVDVLAKTFNYTKVN